MENNASRWAKRIFADKYEGLSTADYTCNGCGTRVQSNALPEGWQEQGKEHYCPNCDPVAGSGTGGGKLAEVLAAMESGGKYADSDFHDWLEYDGYDANPDRLRELGDFLSRDAKLAAWYMQKADRDQDKPYESDLVRHSAFRITGDMAQLLPAEFIVNNIVIPLFYGGHDRATKDGWQAIFAKMNPVEALVSGWFIDEDDLKDIANGTGDFTAQDIASGFGVDTSTARKWVEDAFRSGIKQGQPPSTYRPKP